MNIETIPIRHLLLAFIPVAFVIFLLRHWGLRYGHGLYAISRMLIQLLMIGCVLVFIFDAESSWIIVAVLTVMVVAASWTALNTMGSGKSSLYPASLISIAVGGGSVLVLVTQGVLRLDPWYKPSFMIPLAGMIFAGSMNAISLAIDRLTAEIRSGTAHAVARATAFRTALIPITNTLFAVGLIALPGMMTGQILSGVSPLIAARYQIMVMCMLFGAAGISTACFLLLTRKAAAFGKAG